MDKIKIELDRHEVGQVLDGLEKRAYAYEQTARYWDKGDDAAAVIEGVLFEEVNNADEARSIATFYRNIISKIQQQMDETSYQKTEKQTAAAMQSREDKRGELLGTIRVQDAGKIVRGHLRECDLDEFAAHVENITGAQVEYAASSPDMEVLEVFRTENYMGMLDNNITSEDD